MYTITHEIEIVETNICVRCVAGCRLIEKGRALTVYLYEWSALFSHFYYLVLYLPWDILSHRN